MKLLHSDSFILGDTPARRNPTAERHLPLSMPSAPSIIAALKLANVFSGR
jgi:hypothetical protein